MRRFGGQGVVNGAQGGQIGPVKRCGGLRCRAAGHIERAGQFGAGKGSQAANQLPHRGRLRRGIEPRQALFPQRKRCTHRTEVGGHVRGGRANCLGQ